MPPTQREVSVLNVPKLTGLTHRDKQRWRSQRKEYELRMCGNEVVGEVCGYCERVMEDIIQEGTSLLCLAWN